MVWIIIPIIALVGYILIRFIRELKKDNSDLQDKTLDQLFFVIVNRINDVAFIGRGIIHPVNKTEFSLYETGQNQIIIFQYSTGHLTLTWKYKYFHNEVVHSKQFNFVRNISIDQQQEIAEQMINEMTNVVAKHKDKVLRGM